MLREGEGASPAFPSLVGGEGATARLEKKKLRLTSERAVHTQRKRAATCFSMYLPREDSPPHLFVLLVSIDHVLRRRISIHRTWVSVYVRVNEVMLGAPLPFFYFPFSCLRVRPLLPLPLPSPSPPSALFPGASVDWVLSAERPTWEGMGRRVAGGRYRVRTPHKRLRRSCSSLCSRLRREAMEAVGLWQQASATCGTRV